MNRFEKYQKIFIKMTAPVITVCEADDYELSICNSQCRYCIFESPKGCYTLEEKVKYLEGVIKNNPERRKELINLCSLTIAIAPSKKREGHNELTTCIRAKCSEYIFDKDPHKCCENVKLDWLNEEIKEKDELENF